MAKSSLVEEVVMHLTLSCFAADTICPFAMLLNLMALNITQTIFLALWSVNPERNTVLCQYRNLIQMEAFLIVHFSVVPILSLHVKVMRLVQGQWYKSR